MKIHWLIIPATIFILSFSCENKEDNSEDIPEEQIIGEWGWIESVYYNTMSGKPYILNPDTIGYSLKYVYSFDGTYKVYKNNKLETTGIYWFEIQDYSDERKPDIRLITQQDDYIKDRKFQLKGDSLILDNTEADDAKRIFIKIK